MIQTIRKVLTVEEAKAKQRETIEVELDTLIPLFEDDIAEVCEEVSGQCNSFGADPDCRPEPKIPWDNRGWQPMV